MSEYSHDIQQTALQNFRSARLHADLERVRAVLSGKSADLLSYEEVRQKVRAVETSRIELQDIPLDAIVGSVGRYKDFTRQFFPLVEEDQSRWARVHTLTGSLQGLPPVELFQIGDVYFVRDGNHRVSVARELGATHIEAYVTLVETSVPLEPDVQPDDLIIKERYAHFLELTRLKETYPDLDLTMSAAGNYRVLERQIEVHQIWVKENKGEEISFSEAAVRWYRYIYWPVVLIIRKRGLMRDFPDRTETDLYVWIDKHRHELAEKLDWSVDMETAVADLVTTQSEQSQPVLNRISTKMQDALIPDALEAGPAPGVWRESLLSGHQDRLFARILVAVNGREDGWLAMGQALTVARFEQSHLYGLHVIGQKDDKESAHVEGVKSEFYRRCEEAGISGEFSVESGKITPIICDRARWTDLVVVSLAHPPGPQPVQRLSSQFRQLLNRCPRPVLAVPRMIAKFNKLLLAYDGSPKAHEALFVSAYLAEKWRLPLVIETVQNKQVSKEIAGQARTYLQQRNIQATFLEKAGDPAQIILDTARAEEISLIIMGGYGQNPLVEVVLGSVVDQILRTRDRPILICR